jgi:hypothetical protein
MTTKEVKSCYSVAIEIEDFNGETVVLSTRDFKSKNKAKKCYDFINSLGLDIDGIHLSKTSFKVAKSCYYDEISDDTEEDIVIDLEQEPELMECDTEEEDYEDGVMYDDISGMLVTQYGGGYLLHPNDNDSRVGTKYFMGCFWQPKNNAWFFKKENLKYILAGGAILEDEYVFSETEDEEEEEVYFNDMKVHTYGKGLILIPKKTSQYYGIKYFQGGYWIDAVCGWFFKKDFLDILTKNGAQFMKKHIKSIYEKEQSKKATQEKEAKHTLKWEKYGRGFLLVPSENHPDKGIKYYYSGWWMPNKNAWFFREKTTDIKQ